MAGDWIKVQQATPDKPEVFRLAIDLGIPPEHVVGCLIRLWIWADMQSVDGNAVTVTGVTLDRICCHAGFASALEKVGWLIREKYANDEVYTFPNFDRHNGKTAKTRATTGSRVKRHREKHATQEPLQRNENSVPEKRREENKYIDGFDQFWILFDKKIGRPVAERSWSKIKPSEELKQQIFTAVRKYVLATPDKTFRKNPATWLNQRSWEDEIIPSNVSSLWKTPQPEVAYGSDGI